MLIDNPSYVTVPIYAFDDVEVYCRFGLELCFQKIMFVMQGLQAAPGVAGADFQGHQPAEDQGPAYGAHSG